MLKKRYEFVLLLLCILLINNVSAASRTFNYQNQNTNPLTNAQLYIYSCTDSSCTSIGSTYWNSPTSTTTSSITISGTPSNYNYEFHYTNCYKTTEVVAAPSSRYSGPPSTIQLVTFNPCSSSLSTITVSGTKQVNNPLDFSVNLGQVFSSTLTTLPNEVKSFYDASVDVKLSIKNSNNVEVYTKIESDTVPFGGKSHSFSWTPSQAGDFDISITTKVNDCKCTPSQSDSSPTTKSITIAPAQQPPSCSNECTTPNEKRCNTTTLKQVCTAGSNGCNYWQNTSCSVNNKVCSNGECITQQTTCTENWNCTSWSTGCGDNKLQTRTCTDKNNCGTTLNKPSLTQTCTTNTPQVTQTCTSDWICGDWTPCKDGTQTGNCYDQNQCSTDTQTETRSCNETESQTVSLTPESAYSTEEFNQAMNTTVNVMLSRIAEGIQELIVSNKYYFIISFIIIILIVALAILYFGAHKEKILKPRLKILKSEKKPVKINDLMLSVIESLESDERELCYQIVENEGISQEELQKKLDLNKTKLEIALTKLERRQVIKKREGDNPKIFFNDWLK